MNEFSVLAAAREHPHREALILGREHWTFGGLASRVAEAAAWLQRRLPSRGSFGLLAQGDVATLILLYAAMELGRTVVLLHPRWSERERRRLAHDLGLDGWIEGRELPPPGTVARGEPAGRLGGRAVDDEAILAVMPTSGSTGRPRGVALSRRALLASAAASARNFGWHDGDRWLLSLPLAHIGGLAIVTRCLIARRTVVLPPPTSSFEAAKIVRLIERQRVTLLSLVPTMLQRLLALPGWSPPAHLRVMLVGGASAPPALLAAAADRGWPVVTTYGLTEACAQVATQRYGTVQRGEKGAGRLQDGFEARIRDGVLELRGPALMSGYLPDGSGLDADGWLRTGDRARIDEEGNVFILGRCDDVIVTGGENVDPLEVEQVLAGHPGVAAACVIGVADPEWGQTVVAAVEPAPGQPPTPAQLRGFVRDRLAPYKCPRRFHLLAVLPTNPTGKVDRRAVAEQIQAEPPA